MNQEKLNVTVRSGPQWETEVLFFAKSEISAYLEEILPEGIWNLSVILEPAEEPLRFDGFRIHCGADGIRVQASCARGILHGVYELLRRMGCSFLFPGKRRQRVPARLLCLPEICGECQPWLEFRGLCLYNTTAKTIRETIDAVDWMAKNGYNFLLTSIHKVDDSGQGDHAILWDEIGDELLPELTKRGIVIDMSEHSTDFFFSREELFPQHPEWFALDGGKRRPGQICYSNPEAIEVYGDNLVSFAADKPWIKFLGLWPLDGGGYCQCEACRDPLTIYRANRRIAEKMAAVRPDVTLEYLAYKPRSFSRPGGGFPENMSVLVCNVRDGVAYEWGLQAKGAGGAFYFDYGTGDHYRWQSDLWLNPVWCKETVNAMAAYGYRGIVSLYLPVTCWWQASINYWYLRRYYYEPAADLELLTRELSAELFGTGDMVEVLMMIYRDLQDSGFWNGIPRKHEWYQGHLVHRNTELDAVHLHHIRQTLSALGEKLEAVSVPDEPDFIRNRVYLGQYLELQRVFYEKIEQYHQETDTPACAEAYFSLLRELEAQPDSPFISERYARWRVVGRDNIFTSDIKIYQAEV